jgi:Ala-tRNA(Pro) deacylase
MARRRQGSPVPGALVEVSGRRVGSGSRVGEIVEVLGTEARPHFLVRWEDGHESVLYPGERVTIRDGGGSQAAWTKPPDEIAPPTAALLELLEREHVSVELLPHRRTTSAASEAKALGVLPQTVAKTVVLEGGERKLMRAVVPASMHVDLVKLAELAGARVRQLTEDELAGRYPQFELGAVPPFGGPEGDRVVVDRHVTEADHVVLEGGVHDASLRLAADDLVAVAHAEVADIARS